MAPEHDDVPDRDERLSAVLVACLEAIDRGETRDRQEFLARYPEFAEEVNRFLDDQERVARCAAPLRAVAVAAGTHAGQASSDTLAEVVHAERASFPRCLGDYELLEEIGRGGMAIVYRARQKSLGRIVAVKVIRADDGLARRDAERFRREAELAAHLDHPHIVPVYEVGAQDGYVYFSMKLIEGGSLAEHLDRFVADPRAAARLVATVARAVHHAHQRGVLHRDLKPGNILLDGTGQPHVTDFGLARRVEGDSNLTQSGTLVGTPSYMAPEQTAGERATVTTATDVYGLGAVLYALLTSRPPFRADTPVDTVLLVREQKPEAPRRSNGKIHRDLETICLKCLQKEPQRRYGSAEALAEDLERRLNGDPVQARPAGSWERFWKWLRRRPALAALIGVVTVATIGLVSGLLWHNGQLRQYAKREKAAAQRERHERRLARQAVDRMYTQVATQWLEDEPQLTGVQRSFLEEALHFYQELSKEEPDDPSVRQETARAYRYMGDILAKLERRAEAELAYNQAVANLSQMLMEHPDEPNTVHELAMTYRGLGFLMHQSNRPQEAEKFWKRGLELRKNWYGTNPIRQSTNTHSAHYASIWAAHSSRRLMRKNTCNRAGKSMKNSWPFRQIIQSSTRPWAAVSTILPFGE